MRNRLLKAIGLGVTGVSMAWVLSACQPPAEPSRPLSVEYSWPVAAPLAEVESWQSFDVYVDGDQVHVLLAGYGKAGQSPYVGYVRSEDGGLHWSAPQSLDKVVPPHLESKLGNDVQIAARGQQLMAIWQRTGEIPGMGMLAGAVSVDQGLHWQALVQPIPGDFDQSHADLAVDHQGRFHLVWLDDREENGYQGLRYALSDDAGQHWLQQTLDDSTCSCCWNRLQVDNQDQLQVLFRDGSPRDMAILSSADRGNRWQRAAPMSDFNWQFDGCPHNGGGLAVVGSSWFASQWTGVENRAGLYFVYSPDQGKSWSAPQALGAAGDAPFHSDIAAADAQHVVVVWDARNEQGSAVWFAESFDHGQHWLAARQLSTAGKSANFPRLLRTQSGFVAIWAEQATGEARQWVAAVLR